MTILDKIIEYKRVEVEKRKLEISAEELKKNKFFSKETLSLKSHLVNPLKSGIIAEFKRKSPSKGIINDIAKVDEVVKAYEDAGASGISVLTDYKSFGGQNEDLILAREVLNIPVLRKEFIIDEYQILEAKAIGADAILLIASVLTKERVEELAVFAKAIGLEILFEIHSEDELEKLNNKVDIVGINNRNLKTFEVSIENSIQLFSKIPNHFVKISESGISDPNNVIKLKQVGFQGFLIGENFMRTGDPGKACVEFIEQLKKF